MDPSQITELLKIGGNAGVLWVACWFLVKTLKVQYEGRIEALENAAKACEADRQQLHDKFENYLIQEIQKGA